MGEINDCNSTSEPSRDVCFTTRSVLTADLTLFGTAAEDRTGHAVAAAGDVDGDGFDDLLVGAYGEESSNGAPTS